MQELILDIVDRTSMHAYYDKLYTTRKKRPPLSALIFITDLDVEDLPEIISQRTKLAKSYSTNIENLGDSLHRVSLQRILGLREIRGEFIVDGSFEGIWIVLTNAESYFITHVIERFFKKLYPIISRIYLNYSQIKSVLETIRKSCHGTTTLTFFTIKREKPEPKEEMVYRPRKGTQILWDENVDEDIKRLISDGFVINVDRLDFVLKGENDTILLKAQIARTGLSKLKFGSFSTFYKNVICEIIRYGLDRKSFYGERERNIEKGVIKLRPLQITYASAFHNEQLFLLAKKLSNSYSCSVIHGGNPYFAADLCDCEDGSSFGVAALGNSVTVTPFSRGTPSAVWKLLNRIQEIMGDGEITDVRMR